MKKLFILFFVLLVGIGLMLSNAKADEARSLPSKSKSVLHANTLIIGNGADLLNISGNASSTNCIWAVYDSATVAGATGLAANSQENIKVEGGEATQYDAIGPIDFGPEGLRFVNGITVVTTTCDLTLTYR